jgi:Ran GTPase-activating protein (RanGAP) involved in mRNA processing and transport
MDLSMNHCKEDGGKALGRAFAVLGKLGEKGNPVPNLRKFNIANNRLTTMGATPIIKAFSSFSQDSLTDLNISSNLINDEGKAVCEAIRNGAFASLRYLDMSSCLMGDRGIRMFLTGWLEGDMKLEHLNVNNISVTNMGIKCLGEALQKPECPPVMEMLVLQAYQPLLLPLVVKAAFTKQFKKRVVLISTERDVASFNGGAESELA